MTFIVVENNLCENGLHRVHLMANKEVDEEVLWALVPAEARMLAMVCQVDDEMGIWHTRMQWMAREVVDLPFEDGTKRGVMWWVEAGERARDAIDLAANLMVWNGLTPRVAFVPEEVKASSPLRVTLLWRDGHQHDVEREVRAEGWVPKRFVVVC